MAYDPWGTHSRPPRDQDVYASDSDDGAPPAVTQSQMARTPPQRSPSDFDGGDFSPAAAVAPPPLPAVGEDDDGARLTRGSLAGQSWTVLVVCQVDSAHGVE